MAIYFRRKEMMKGGPFKCFNCGRLLVIELQGSCYKIKLFCTRCKCEITIEMKEPVPFQKKD